MGLDYYGVLGVKKSSKRIEIQEAYRKLSIRCHPDQPGNQNVDVINEFTLISEAYDVLSDHLRRCVYDQFGEEGIKNGAHGPNREYFKPYSYHGNPFVTFRQFFGTNCPYGNYSSVLLDPPEIYQIGGQSGYKTKGDPVHIDLELTLKELYYGCCKKMKVHHQVFVDDKKTLTALREKVLSIPIRRNIKAGTNIVFKEAGDQGATKIAGDIIFVVKDLTHPTFQRNGDDLITYQSVSLEEALLGTTVVVKTLDDRIIRVPITDIIHPEYEKIVQNEGMPKTEDLEESGNLIIKFKIEFPKMLSKNNKELIKQTFQQLSIQ